MNEFIFERPYGKHVWRLQITDEPGRAIVSWWPWYVGKDGELYPNKRCFGGGFQMPLECLPELRDAINNA